METPMNTKPFAPGPSGHAMTVTRVADGQWQVLEDGLLAGRGHAMRRPDGRLFVSIDAWHSSAFDRLAEVMLADLPAPLRIVPAGEADEALLQALDRAIREEVEAGAGWQSMPAEVRPRPEGVTIVDASRYAVAAAPDRYLGLLRLATATRQPRIGLVAVRAGEHRRGIARALLSHVLGTLHRSGITAASAEVDESNQAALALFDGIGGQRISSNLELAR